MTALVVGGDKLGNIPDLLEINGIKNYIHWTGRKKGLRKKQLPKNIDLIIVLYDYVEHNLTKIIKKHSKTLNIPCIFSKRGCSDLHCQLNKCNLCKKCDYIN